MVSGVGEEAGTRELVFNRYRVSAGEDEKLLEVDRGDNSATK